MAIWTKVCDGQLVLEGTPMQIKYEIDNKTKRNYAIYQGDMPLGSRWQTLQMAKRVAEERYQALVEIGVI